MTRPRLDVDALTVSSPCSVPWSSMDGDAARRFCGQCRLHVYDLSEMTRAEIADLVERTGGRFCKRIWRRPDGRIVTKDCHRIRRALARRLRVLRTAAAGLFALLGLGGCGAGADSRESSSTPASPSAEGACPVPPPATPATPVETPPVRDANVITGR